MRLLLTTICCLFTSSLIFSQNAAVKGQLQNQEGEAIIYANVALYNQLDSALVKVETTDETGIFKINNIKPGNYWLKASYVGLPDLIKNDVQLIADQQLDLGVLSFALEAIELEAATVKADRAMVEVKPDRMVFNVQGTINSTGDNALSLLRKAPGVTVDNNDNVNVLGRSGVLIYVDGKRLPIGGEELSNYLQNLQADQIDKIDIISNPGAKYEAEGNAGIIDIRLKKDKNLGANGSASYTYSQGDLSRMNGNLSGNYRNKTMNVFGSLGAAEGEGFNDMKFYSLLPGNKIQDESNYGEWAWTNFNARLGTDFFLNKKHTIGFLVSVMENDSERNNLNRIKFSESETPNRVDSVLVADNKGEGDRSNQTYNLNYRFDNSKGRTLNVDLDYGSYGSTNVRDQPNRYFDATETVLLRSNIFAYDTPTDIDIYTFKIDYEQGLLGGQLGFGSKLSRVDSKNTFQVFDSNNGSEVLIDNLSNQFNYEENVYAGYVSYSRPLSQKWNLMLGLRAEQTDSDGELTTFSNSQNDTTISQNYLSWFPNAGLTFQAHPQHSLSLNYGRRINRPDYNVLNPFRNQLSEISYEKGNERLLPEIVNNIELGYTYNYRYNLKLAYSKTTDQITRLIGPDNENSNKNATFITWANLANQTIWSANLSAPVQVNEWWNAFFNISASHLDNQADYGENGVVDVQAFTYSFYTQQTFNLFWKLKGEISGYYSGPGVWGGVFEYDPSWSLNLGLQRKFFDDQLNVRVSANDIFYESWWSGVSEFNGLISSGRGLNDSRRVSISLSYNFGNQNVKSRKRKTGIEDEAGRVGN